MRVTCRIDSHQFSLYITGNIFVEFQSPLLRNSHAEAHVSVQVYGVKFNYSHNRYIFSLQT